MGKSTLLNVIAGLELPDEGTVLFNGVNLAGLEDSALTRVRREHMGFVFQAFHVLPYLTVSEKRTGTTFPVGIRRHSVA